MIFYGLPYFFEIIVKLLFGTETSPGHFFSKDYVKFTPELIAFTCVIVSTLSVVKMMYKLIFPPSYSSVYLSGPQVLMWSTDI